MTRRAPKPDGSPGRRSPDSTRSRRGSLPSREADADPFFDACPECGREVVEFVDEQHDEAPLQACLCETCGETLCHECYSARHSPCPALEARDMLDDLEREDELLAEYFGDDPVGEEGEP